MKKGVLVALSGVDGSGKTTQAQLLNNYLKKKGKKTITIKVFDYLLLTPVISLSRKITGNKRTGPVKKNRKAILKLWFIPAFGDFWLNYLLRIYPKLYKYDFVISDRYFPDLVINLLYYGYMPQALLPLIKYLPKATKNVLLSLPAKVAWSRSRDFTQSYYSKQGGLYQKVSEVNLLYNLEATKTKKEVFSNLVNYINAPKIKG